MTLFIISHGKSSMGSKSLIRTVNLLCEQSLIIAVAESSITCRFKNSFMSLSGRKLSLLSVVKNGAWQTKQVPNF